MKKTPSLRSVPKRPTVLNDRDEKQRKLEQILKRQTERNVLQPVGGRKFRNWNDVKSDTPDQSRSWF